MYSVKPGRGPSLMGAIGGVGAVIFGFFWTATVANSGAPPFFALFGVIFILMGIGGVLYNLYNATAKNRMSDIDITTDNEESDPIANAMGHGPKHKFHSRSEHLQREESRHTQPNAQARQYEGNFCPFCGNKVEDKFDFCPKCGKDI